MEAINTNFGYFSEGYSWWTGPVSLNWGFINDIVDSGELSRFANAADDVLLKAGLTAECGKDCFYDIGAQVFIQNRGLLIGTVHMDTEDGVGNVFNNDGTWFTRGTSDFYGWGDELNNMGLVQAAFEDNVAEYTEFRSLNDTYNLGVMSLLDGGAEDRLVLDGDYNGGFGPIPFGLAANSEIEENGFFFLEDAVGHFALDARLANEEATGDYRADGDTFFIDGRAYGSTGIIVNKLYNPNPGFNWEGIHVVSAEDGSENLCDGYTGDGYICKEGDAFFISPFSQDYFEVNGVGLIQDGLYMWALLERDDYGPGAEDYYLVSTGGPGAQNAPGIATGAQTIWYQTDDIVPDHQFGGQIDGNGGGGADLAEPNYAGPVYADSPSGTKSGLFAKATGTWAERDSNVTIDGLGSVDTGTDQNIYSIIGGADMKPWGADSPIRIGIFGGYATSNLDFNFGDSSVDYEGGIVGGYVAYNNGSFYADATVKADLLNADYSFDGIDVGADVNTIGVRANVGNRFGMGGSGFFEPVASFAYANADVDNFSDGMGSTVNFSNGESMRAGAGARIGTKGAMGNHMFELSLLGKAWYEFEDANTVTVTDGGGNTATYTDDIQGWLGEASATLQVSNSADTISGFVSGGGTFSDDLTAWNAKVGIRTDF